jgi:cysteine desulfurase
MASYYFDYNATTPTAPEVLEAMEPYLRDFFGNPSSVHHLGREAASAVKRARAQVAGLVGAAEENEIVFTSGGTESNNAAVRSMLVRSGGKKKIVTSAVEHSSLSRLFDRLETEGYQIRRISVDREGALDAGELRDSLDEQTALVSLMAVNNETGVVFPVERWAPVIKERDIFFHVDAVQALGKIPLDLKETGIDCASFSAHKGCGPKGIGALYVKKGVPFQPFLYGGPQERGRRAGTENVAAIAGFAAACVLIRRGFFEETERVAGLRNSFEEEVMSRIPDVSVVGAGSVRVPHTSRLIFGEVDGETLLLKLDQAGICVSLGSACLSGSSEPSPVLKAMGFNPGEARGSLRFSFGRYTAPSDMEYLIHHLAGCVAGLRS